MLNLMKLQTRVVHYLHMPTMIFVMFEHATHIITLEWTCSRRTVRSPCIKCKTYQVSSAIVINMHQKIENTRRELWKQSKHPLVHA